VRIVAGRWGGRRLASPAGSMTRPTSERVREALFSILGSRVHGARVVDLCAGSGALGFEALSRGASFATFVEKNRRAAAVIEANAASLGLGEAELRVRVEPVARFMRRWAEPTGLVDLVLCDPPWTHASEVSAALFEAAPRVLAPAGLVVIEHRSGAALEVPPALRRVDARQYGDTALLVCARKDSAP